jgi:hypothetical protein
MRVGQGEPPAERLSLSFVCCHDGHLMQRRCEMRARLVSELAIEGVRGGKNYSSSRWNHAACLNVCCGRPPDAHRTLAPGCVRVLHLFVICEMVCVSLCWKAYSSQSLPAPALHSPDHGRAESKCVPGSRWARDMQRLRNFQISQNTCRRLRCAQHAAPGSQKPVCAGMSPACTGASCRGARSRQANSNHRKTHDW